MRELGNETVVDHYLVYSATYPYNGPRQCPGQIRERRLPGDC